MLRLLRHSDISDISNLLEANFPEENRLLGKDADAIRRVANRAFQPHVRLLLALVRLFRGPVFSFYVIEDGGHVVATSFVSYGPESGYIAMVSVDPAHRRKGYAARAVTACIDSTRRARKPYVVLDVLEQNAPARTLYEKLGFQELTRRTLYSRTLDGAGGPAVDLPPGLRPFRGRDAEALAAIGQEALPPKVREVLPVRRADFTTPPLVAQFLVSETEAWVAGRAGEPRGFVRATVGGTMAAANLTAPLLHPDLPDASANALIGHAVNWAIHRKAPRLVTEVPATDPRAGRLLEGAGFVPSLRVLALYRSTAP